jgi:hypothetical protein
MEFLCKIFLQKIGFDRILSDSGQYYINLSPIKNNNFGWSQILSHTNFLWFIFSKLARVSKNLAMGPIGIFLIGINYWGFQPHQKLYFWIGSQFISINIFFALYIFEYFLHFHIYFQIQITYFHIYLTFSFRSSPLGFKLQPIPYEMDKYMIETEIYI